MRFWLRNTETQEIVAGFRIPHGYSARDAVNNWLEQQGIKERENYKIIYTNPYKIERF